MPLLTARWPHFADATARSALLCAEQESLLDELLSEELAELISVNGALAIAPLEAMSPVRRAALLRRWLASHRATMPSRAMLGRIWDEVAQAREDATPCVHLNGFDVRRYKGQLWWVKSTPRLQMWCSAGHRLRNRCCCPGIWEACLWRRQAMCVYRKPMNRSPCALRPAVCCTLSDVTVEGSSKNLAGVQCAALVARYHAVTFYGETLIAAAGVFITEEGWAESGVGLEWKA